MSNQPEDKRGRQSRRRRSTVPRPSGSTGTSEAANDQPHSQRKSQRGGHRHSTGTRQPSGPNPAQLAKAAEHRAAVSVPPITYPEQLPVSARRDEIAATIAAHQVVILAGETGSGKTTQLPKILLDLGRGRAGQIGHTQPRRIAARTVAERIAEELGVSLGDVVGYQVRFTDQSSENTLVKVMTDGILLAQLQRDPQLLAYDTLIIDEAHERSLNIDFILGYLARLLPQRPDLKIIITSATIDSERFAKHFGPEHLRTLANERRHGRALTPDPAPTPGPAPAPAPVIQVTGRTFPVEVRYRPLVEDAGTAAKAHAEERDLMTGIVEAVDELASEGPGDVLVFLSGEREILDAADALQGHFGQRTMDNRRPDYVEILPLYARLSAAEQHRVFQSHAGRRIVLSTNVAETSLTVPGVRYVVDPGTARISRYSKATKVQRLPIEAISQASANQRSGRCGRVADGIAIRLYSEEDFDARPEFTEPEILRTSLASVLLQMLSVGVATSPADVTKFPFVEPPDTRAVRDGVQLLTELGALAPRLGKSGRPGADAGSPRSQAGPPRADDEGLTQVGRDLALLPMDPRLARMILEGSKHGVVREVMIIAAALSVQDPRERPAEERAQADQMHARFTDPTSDFLTYLNLWEFLREQQRELSGSAFRRLCRQQYLNYMRIREWQDVVSQLREMAKPLGIRVNLPSPSHQRAASAHPVTHSASHPAQTPNPEQTPSNAAESLTDHPWPSDNIHRSLLAGLLSQLGMQDTGEVKASAVAHLRGEARERALKRAKKQSRNEYIGARGAKFAIFPGSPLSKKPPAWIMAGELVETSRLWARDVARVQPEWAETLAAHLVRRTYSDPTWSRKRGAAVAREKVLLYGVPIVADRTVLYGKVEPAIAREMFIRHALVEGDWVTHHHFAAHNAEVRREADDLEARSRRRGLVLDDEALVAFYDERIPDDVVSARHFDTWWKTARRANPDLLDLTLEALAPEAEAVDPALFPKTWPQGEQEFALTYQFNPGTDEDGVTVHIPVAALNQVVPNGFDWLVPGMLDELAVATIKSLPKAIRVQLVPAPDVARLLTQWIRSHLPAWADIARAGDMAEPFHQAFARAAREVRSVDIPAEAFDDHKLPPHLRLTLRVIDYRSGTAILLEESKDLSVLQRRLAPQAQSAVRSAVKTALRAAFDEAAGAPAPTPAVPSVPAQSASAPPAPSAGLPFATDLAATWSGEQSSLTTWPIDVGVLPEVIETTASGVPVRGYPGLVLSDVTAAGARATSGTGTPSVSLRVHSDPAERDAAHSQAVRELILGEVAFADGRITSRWSAPQSLTLAAGPYATTPALVRDLQRAAVMALTPNAVQIRDYKTYIQQRDEVRLALEDAVYGVVGHVVAALTAARDLDSRLRSTTSLTLLATATELRQQESDLLRDGFISKTPPHRLPHLVRYLRAAIARLDKAEQDPQRDANLAQRVTSVRDSYRRLDERRRAEGKPVTDIADVPWLIEELRVSLFAQQLGTDGPVSEKRIHKVLGTTGW